MRNDVLQSKRLSAPYPQLLIAVMATSVMIWWATAPRREMELPSFATTANLEARLDVWEVAGALPALAIPLLLFYLLTAVEPFQQRLITRPGLIKPDRLIWSGFIALHLVTLIWLAFQETWPLAISLFPLLLGSILFGWRMGVVLGLLSAATVTVIDIVVHEFVSFYGQAVPELLREGGLGETLVQLWQDFQWLFLAADRTIYVWCGLIAGLTALLLDSKRIYPVVSFAIGLAFSYLVLVIPTLGYDVPNLLTAGDTGLAIAIAIGLSLAMFILRSAQATLARAEAEAARNARLEAELLALRSQINPHFFFNSLNTIRHLVRVDQTAARGLLLDLSTIFQRVLRAGDFVSLAEELEHVEAYLSLEKARLEERLQVNIVVPASSYLETPVPTLTLQPLVENAVIHGLAPRRDGGTLTLKVEPQQAQLHISIIDNGVGMSPNRLGEVLGSDRRSGSIGLRNVDQRLRSLYGEAYGLDIQTAPDEGTTVLLRIPSVGE